jgi:aspartyl-tRNA(Asn)/glutamyl-tRNA(Gln) amidotransferase subunit C
MSLPRETVAKVARLARLELSDAELQAFTGQLGAILEYVARLDELDTSQVEPLVHAVEVANVLRHDVLSPSLPRSAALANAPKSDGKYFLVPAIIEG